MKSAALVLAAGKSTRISPLADGRPKPLLEIAGESLLGWNLRWLQESGVEDVWVNLHFQADEIRAAIGDGGRYGVRIHYSYEEEILGTAGGWKKVAGEHEGTWIVAYGDNLTRLDLNLMHAAHHPDTLLAALFDAERHANTGIHGGAAVLEGDRIVKFNEGGTHPVGARLINAGVYVAEAQLARAIPDGFADFGKDVFPALAGQGKLRGHVVEETAFCLGLDTPEHFERGKRMVLDGTVTL